MLVVHALAHAALTLVIIVAALFLEHFAPKIFYWLMALVANRTWLGRLMKWRRCDARYYTNDRARVTEHVELSASQVQQDFEAVGLVSPALDTICAVEEKLVVVSFLSRYVVWREDTGRVRVYGLRHQYYVIGTWHDWHPDGGFRGTVFVEFGDDEAFAQGIWCGAGLRRSKPRAFPWIWAKLRKYDVDPPSASDEANAGLSRVPPPLGAGALNVGVVEKQETP